MVSHPRISQLLVETQAYRDLPQPVILTSGELGIYYINTEKLVQDGGAWEKVGEDSQAMIGHAIKMMYQKPTFGEVINILTEKADQILENYESKLISGGQRRDWLFSGPVAYSLDIPHASLYKDGRMEILGPQGGPFFPFAFSEAQGLHVSDLLTEGSSCYKVGGGAAEEGWIPTLRRTGANVNDLVAVVTRLQGGEENLARQQVTVHSFVAIDEDFLRQYSKNPEQAVAYFKNPNAWSEAYLREDGALALLPNFDPKGGKIDRVRKFLQRYGGVLKESGRWEELDKATKEIDGCGLVGLVS